MTQLVDFLFPAPAPRRTASIVAWWETRRLGYNAIVGAAGTVSLVVVHVVTRLPPGAQGLPAESWWAVIVFGVLANVCYTLGPAAEIAIEKVWGRKVLPSGPTLFRMGLTFSAGLALLPTLISGLDWLFRILRTIF